ncbi:hypothetical protein CIHG_06909 [Coccidioides immitis H538.4]|uniref:Uncharacterized protein n=1 Tax=Coccidioides immitis H538.4 TaxID=396776 RepID=A0A0J8RYG6_COCIT|nr:hypothetical protein CIHG_06909 [Coccidioides immitis H538.4]
MWKSFQCCYNSPPFLGVQVLDPRFKLFQHEITLKILFPTWT